MIVRATLSICFLAACGESRVAAVKTTEGPPRAAVAEPTAGSAAQPTTTTRRTFTWRDFDALPPGALQRFGSQRLVSNTSVVAIRNDGTLALIDDDYGLIEVRRDGMFRVLAAECAGGLVHYVADELHADCGTTLYSVQGDVVTSAPSPCEGKTAVSRSGEYLACFEAGQTDDKVELFRWPNTPMWKLATPQTDPRRVLVSDAGDVILVESEQLRAIRRGAIAWTKPLELEWSGIARSYLVGWEDETDRFVRIGLADGNVLGRTPLEGYSVAREIGIVPDGGSYFVAIYGRYPGDPADKVETFRARVDANTGKLLATWRGHDYEWGNAISPNGQFAASVGIGRILRVRLDDPSAAPDRTTATDEPSALALSRDNKTIAYVTSGPEEDQLVIFDAVSGARRASVPAPNFVEAIALSADGKRIALAGKHGGFAIHDARTGAAQCTSEEIPGATLWWHGSRLVSHYPGDNGDDCDEITEGAITVIDDRCRIVKQHSIYGMLHVLDASTSKTTVAMADWKNECGSGYELKPWRAFAIDHKTGAKAAAPKLDGEWARREKAAEAAAQAAAPDDAATIAIAEQTTVLSTDGRTRLIWEYDHDSERSFLSCIDVASKQTLVKHELPKGVGEPYAIASDGRWSVASDRGSLLRYACRDAK